MRFEVTQGDALTVLRRMPAESVQTCVTSPPYWGLRDYGISPLVWGGDPDHSHEWGAAVRTPWANDVRGPNGRVKNGAHSSNKPKVTGPFCACGAWRGVLGLEPTIDLYVAHVVEVFREVRRVLRNDGTLWLNLGDSYATGAGKACAPGGGHQGEAFAGPRGYRGGHNPSPKHRGEIIPDFQPNRMPQPGLKPKDLCMIPARVALALQADGWWLRSEIVWHKTNPMPESIRDRPTKSHEMLYLLSKSERYYYNADAIKEPTTGSAHDRARKDRAYDGQKTLPTGERNGIRAAGVNPKAQKWPNAWSAEKGRHDGVGNGRFRPKQNASFSAAVTRTVERRNKRTVWTVSTKPFKGAHFATFPPKLIEPCILAGSCAGDVVLDPFNGAGTTGVVAAAHGRDYQGIELKAEYIEMSYARAGYALEAA